MLIYTPNLLTLKYLSKMFILFAILASLWTPWFQMYSYHWSSLESGYFFVNIKLRYIWLLHFFQRNNSNGNQCQFYWFKALEFYTCSNQILNFSIVYTLNRYLTSEVNSTFWLTVLEHALWELMQKWLLSNIQHSRDTKSIKSWITCWSYLKGLKLKL